MASPGCDDGAGRADVAIADDDGRTALDHVGANGYADMVTIPAETSNADG